MSLIKYCKKHDHVFRTDECDLCIKPSKDPEPSKDVKVKRSYKKRIKKSIWERFHNYGVKFTADIEWDHLFKYSEIHLNNNVSYKRIDLPDALIKVFKKSILVTLRSSREIKGLKVRDAEQKSQELVNKVLDQLPLAIKIHDRSVVNTHNAFVNHPTATHDVTVKVNDEVRAISDHSRGHSEFEFVHPDHAVSDSEILEVHNQDLIENHPDPLSVQQKKIGFIMDSLANFSENMNRHVSVMERIDQGIIKLNGSLEKISKIGSEKRSGIKGSLRMISPNVQRYRSERLRL